jgi:glycosyltransferase involved in cell wall biosynthesis
MPNLSRLLVVTAVPFQPGDITANRILALVRAACPAGSTALLVNDWRSDEEPDQGTPQLPPDIELLTLPTTGRGRWARLVDRFTRGWRVVRAIRAHEVDLDEVAAICLPAELMSLTTAFVLRSALGRPLIVDVAEWQGCDQFFGGMLAPAFLRHRWSAWLTARLADRVVAASTRLGRGFAERNLPTLVVPPLVDCAEFAVPAPPPIHQRLRLVYAGTPTRTDLLDVVVRAIGALPPAERDRIELVIGGVDRAHARHSELRHVPGVTFAGQLPRTQVLELLARAHFSVLIRPRRGYADAGFPAKVSESLAAGCPVLVNHINDLPAYISDGREGILVNGHTEEDVVRGLRSALALDDLDWHRMSRAASKRARESFDFRSWSEVMQEFFIPSTRDRNSSPPAPVGH